jgi:hypothetical protein
MTANRLNALRLLVEDRHVSLYTLNAPQEAMNGVTPLGFAAWMNSPKAVEVLLEVSGGAVSVDGQDAYGVTPLMCKCGFSLLFCRAKSAQIRRTSEDATRDGNLEVVDCLVSMNCLFCLAEQSTNSYSCSWGCPGNSFGTGRTPTTEIEITEPPYSMPSAILRSSGLARKRSATTGRAKFGHVL